MNVLDLFSGIGGFSLGLERAGMRTVAFCEANAHARAVLRKHWPDVPCYDDVATLTGGRLASDGIAADVICGGFPCQDLSTAGKGAGLDGKRSGLWFEYARIISEVRPSYVIVENVAALLGRGLNRVLGDLASLGYDAEWHCIPATAVGAPHRRDRLWIVANTRSGRFSQSSKGQIQQQGRTKVVGDFGRGSVRDIWSSQLGAGNGGQDVADAECWGSQGGHVECSGPPAIIPAAYSGYCGGSEFGAPWRIEPDVGRVAYGVPAAMDRLERLGNSVVPQIPEIIGRAIMRAQV